MPPQRAPYRSHLVLPRVFGPRQCERIVRAGQARPGDGAPDDGAQGDGAPGDGAPGGGAQVDGAPGGPATGGVPGPGPAARGELAGVGAAPEQVRDSAVTWLPRDGELAWVADKLAAVVERANRTYRFDLDPPDGPAAEDLQFTGYDRPGAHYTWHADGLEPGVEHRKLSVVVQLTDPARYRGGRLEFPDLFAADGGPAGPWVPAHRELLAAQGTAVVFPSFEYHRVTPLRSGVRHSLVWWVAGPPFR